MALPLQVSQWLNTGQPLVLEQLRGRVVALHAFQMLCPGCVLRALPQMQAVHEAFGGDGLSVVGLHTVFEHHDAMNPRALEAFVHEFRLGFPIGIDQAGAGPLPLTMQAYALAGTPSLVLIDRGGAVRLRHFGLMDDLRLGAALGRLLAEPAAAVAGFIPAGDTPAAGCAPGGCGFSPLRA
jgi:hypothetical protein